VQLQAGRSLPPLPKDGISAEAVAAMCGIKEIPVDKSGVSRFIFDLLRLIRRFCIRVGIWEYNIPRLHTKLGNVAQQFTL
jgi:hypothetical protein